MTATADDKTTIFFQPSFDKTWGTPSGSLTDTAGSVHQANINHNFSDNYSLKLGRQELAYGDHLIIGNVGWSNVGRSFDAAVFTAKAGPADIDVISAKIVDNTDVAPANGDENFYGVYAKMGFGDYAKNLDVYHLIYSNASVSPTDEASASGVRLKSDFNKIDYRVEFISEKFTSSSESLMDLEVGYKVHEERNIRVAAEYFSASKGYEQFYPTGHKWLGTADLFSRKNLNGIRAGVSGNVTEKINASLDYHMFSRTDDATDVYNFSGAAYGGSGSEKAVASEIDLSLSMNLSDGYKLAVGGSTFTPGDYMKTVGSESGTFGYFELTASY